MVRFLKKNKVAIYTKFVKNPRKHFPYQVIVHNQGFYPVVFDSFKSSKKAEKFARSLIKRTKKILK